MGEMSDYYLDLAWDNDEEACYWLTHNIPAYRKKAYGPGKCPKCGSDTIEKNGKFGRFFGCTRWPKCNGSRYCT